MFREFSDYYLNKARYELIDEGKTYYGEIPDLKGVWAAGKTLEECRQNLLDTMEGWIILRLRKNLPVPHLNVPLKKLSLNGVYGKT